VEAQRHGESEQHTADTNIEPEATAGTEATASPAPDQRRSTDDLGPPEEIGLDFPISEFPTPVLPIMDDDTVVIDAEAVEDPPHRPPRAFDSFSDDEPGAAFFAGFDHDPAASRATTDDEVLEGEEDEDAAPVLRVGGWLPDIEIEPSPVSLADSITALLPVVDAGSSTDIDLAPAPELNLPVRRQRAWLLPGGRNSKISDDWEPQHKLPRTKRLRNAAVALAIVGIGAVAVYSVIVVAGSKAAHTQDSGGATGASTDSAGGVLVGGPSPSASPSPSPQRTPKSTKTGKPTGSPSATGSPIDVGGPPTASPSGPFSFEIEAEAAQRSDSSLVATPNALASGGQVLSGLNQDQNSVWFDVAPPVAGTYHVTIWYAESQPETVTMTVNGQIISQQLPHTAANQTIESFTIDASLVAGNNTITWTSTISTGPNLDRFSVAP